MGYRLVENALGPVVPYSDVYDDGGDWIGSVAQENDPPVWVPVNTWGANLCLGGRGSYATVHDAVEALYADYRQDRGDLWLLQTVLTFGRVEKPEGPELTQTVWAPAQGFEGWPFGDLGYLGQVAMTRPGQFRALGETPPAVPYRSGVEAASLEAVCCDPASATSATGRRSLGCPIRVDPTRLQISAGRCAKRSRVRRVRRRPESGIRLGRWR